MKKVIMGLLLVALLLPISLAEDNTTLLISPNPNVNENVTLPNPKILPDNPLWGLKLAFEKIQLMLTFNEEKRAEIALQHAAERLAEVQKMIEMNKMEAAEKAQREYQKEMNQSLKVIEKMKEKNMTKEVIKLQEKLQVHEKLMEKINEKIKEGNFSEIHHYMLMNMTKEINGTALKVKVKIEHKEKEILKEMNESIKEKVKNKIQEKVIEKIENKAEEHGTNVTIEKENNTIEVSIEHEGPKVEK